MSDQKFKELEFADALKERYSRLYINDGSKNLIIGWSRWVSAVWLILFGPIYYWTKGFVLWAFISLIPYWVVLVEYKKLLKGEDLPIYYGFAVFYAITLIGAKGRIIKRGRKLSGDVKPIFDGENLILGTPDQNNNIMADGFDKFMDGQKKRQAAEREKEKAEEFKRKRDEFIKSASKDYEKSIASRSRKFKFVDGVGFGIHPDFIKFSWSVANPELSKIRDQSNHIANLADITTLEARKAKAALTSVKAIVEDEKLISISLGKEDVRIDEVIAINVDERQQVRRAREEKTEYITKGVAVSNVASIGDSPISIARSKTVAETKIKEERGDIVVNVEFELKDGRKIAAENKFDYEGDVAEKAYFEFLDFADYIKKYVSRAKS